MIDLHLRPEKYLTAEDVSSLVGGNEELVQQMYRAHLIDAAELRRGKVVFSPSEARRWKNWYWEHWRDYEKYLCASEKILAGFFAAGIQGGLSEPIDDASLPCNDLPHSIASEETLEHYREDVFIGLYLYIQTLAWGTLAYPKRIFPTGSLSPPFKGVRPCRKNSPVPTIEAFSVNGYRTPL